MLPDTKNIAPIIIGSQIFYLKLVVLLLLKNMGAIAQGSQLQAPQAISSLLASRFALSCNKYYQHHASTLAHAVPAI